MEFKKCSSNPQKNKIKHRNSNNKRIENNKIASLNQIVPKVTLNVNGLYMPIKTERWKEWNKKWPNYILSIKNSLKISYIYIESKRMEKIYHANMNQKKSRNYINIR